MSQAIEVVVLVGSVRKKSFNRMLAQSLAELVAPSMSLRIVEISDLSYYNDELEADLPASWQRIRQEVGAADAVLFVTPEYNRSVPAVLKNAVDVLSRPYGKSVLAGKPAAVISSSPGALGGFGANHHLRQSLVGIGVNTMPTPEAYIGGIATAFDEQGKLVNASTKEFLQTFIKAFEQWVRRSKSA
ncbi:chromate reductase [Paucimonas lemoignei]|uniref:Chromate reductase n=1 Tax=Paucimonas lemoignei TaxID=29443 RepID=A0A4R3HSY6_PAULE|nr:NAD(P)H-dependent oxidoreductase [Paucimonas lemoignei]TCS36296.1 chromate reductase [Paucimonas lemoignei]